jgi:heme/copper-type cytochrome/quinol oxidase subunit 2
MPFRVADAVFWIAVACCSIAQLAILRSAIVSPARTAASQAPSSAARRATEIAWALLPGVALVILFVYTWSAMHQFSAVVAANALP